MRTWRKERGAGTGGGRQRPRGAASAPQRVVPANWYPIPIKDVDPDRVPIEGMRAATALSSFCGTAARHALGGSLRSLLPGRLPGRSHIGLGIALPSLLPGGRSAPQHRTMATDPAHTNRLAKSESPYLLQNAHNPVKESA